MNTSAETVAVGLHLIANSTSDSTELSMIARWRKEYDAYKTRKTRRRLVYEAIAEGYDTVAEISAHTRISQASVRRIIVELLSKNRIKSARTKNPNNRIELRFETATVFG